MLNNFLFRLDPICCESPQVIVDQLSCATERLNLALMPFEHTIVTDDFIYRQKKLI